jgi:hypothetical protein
MGPLKAIGVCLTDTAPVGRLQVGHEPLCTCYVSEYVVTYMFDRQSKQRPYLRPPNSRENCLMIAKCIFSVELT